MAEKQVNRARTQRADPVVNPVSTESEAAWRAALQYADEAALKIEGQWGIGKLERLVAPELAAKFAMAQWQLDDAIRAGDAQLAAQKSAAIARGWHALDKAARDAGHTPETLGRSGSIAVTTGRRHTHSPSTFTRLTGCGRSTQITRSIASQRLHGSSRLHRQDG